MSNINITVPENLTEDEIVDFIRQELTKHNVDLSTLYPLGPADWDSDTGAMELTVSYDYAHFDNTHVNHRSELFKVEHVENVEDLGDNSIADYLKRWEEFVKEEK